MIHTIDDPNGAPTTATEKFSRLREIACDIDNFRREQDWSDTRLAKEIPFIGSTKTFRKITSGDLTELNLDDQLKRYESAGSKVQNLRKRALPAEPIITTFNNVQNVLKAAERASNEPGIARCVIVKGANGTGKTTARNELLKQYAKVAVSCEADETWRDSLNVPYGDIIDALSIRRQKVGGEAFKVPIYPPARQALILEELNKSKRILVIDECHRMGPRGLNMVTTLINKSLVVPVLFGLPVLINRLFTAAYEEAIQLTGNRLAEIVTLDSPQADEVLELFEARGVRFDDDETAGEAVANLVSEAPKLGNWEFIKKVQRECFKMATATTAPINKDQFTKAFTTARRRCVQEQKRN